MTPWTEARQASLSFTMSQSLLKLMFIELVMLSNHLILCRSSSPPAFHLSQYQGLFQWVCYFHQVAKVLELQLQHQSFQWIFRTDFLWDWLIWSPCCPKDSQNSSRAPQSESINSLALSLLYGPGLLPIHNYGKTVALTIQNCSRLKMLFIFIFYWSLSALQRCVGFAVQQHESAICVHISTAS